MAAELVSIRLEEKLVRSVERLAQSKGVTRSKIVRDALTTLLARDSAGASSAPQAVWARLIGCVHGGRSGLSAKTGDEFRRLLRTRRRRSRSR